MYFVYTCTLKDSSVLLVYNMGVVYTCFLCYIKVEVIKVVTAEYVILKHQAQNLVKPTCQYHDQDTLR